MPQAYALPGPAVGFSGLASSGFPSPTFVVGLPSLGRPGPPALCPSQGELLVFSTSRALPQLRLLPLPSACSLVSALFPAYRMSHALPHPTLFEGRGAGFCMAVPLGAPPLSSPTPVSVPEPASLSEEPLIPPVHVHANRATFTPAPDFLPVASGLWSPVQSRAGGRLSDIDSLSLDSSRLLYSFFTTSPLPTTFKQGSARSPSLSRRAEDLLLCYLHRIHR